MLLEMLGMLGLKAELTRKSVIDPRQDVPPIPLGGPMPFGASQEAIDAWLEHWPSERIPALGRLTPASRPGERTSDRASRHCCGSLSTTRTRSRTTASQRRTSASSAKSWA